MHHHLRGAARLWRLVVDADIHLPLGAYGVAGIDGQVDQRVFKVISIDLDAGSSFRHGKRQLHTGAHGVAQQVVNIVNHLAQVHHHGALGLAAAEGHQLAGQSAGFLDGLVNGVQVRQCLLVMNALFQHIAVEVHDEQQVVQIVRDTAGQMVHQLALLHRNQLLLHMQHLVQVELVFQAHLLQRQCLRGFLVLEVINVDGQPHHIGQLIVVAHHLDGGAVEPAIAVVMALESVIHPGIAGLQHEVHEPGVGARNVVGVHRGDPALFLELFLGGMLAKQIPLQRLVEPVNLSIGLVQPHMQRSAVNELQQLFVQIALAVCLGRGGHFHRKALQGQQLVSLHERADAQLHFQGRDDQFPLLALLGTLLQGAVHFGKRFQRLHAQRQ